MLGFIGTGNMASAIIKGIISSSFLKGEEIAVYDKDSEKAKALSLQYAVNVLSDEKEVAKKCSEIVLSVKPNVLPLVLDKIKDKIKEKSPLLISIAAGKSLDFISSCLENKEARIVRVMPNINAVVLQAISAYCPNDCATKEDAEFTEKLCSSFGKAVYVPENQFSVYSAIGGCSPAFAYMFIDSLARAAVKNGMQKATALEVAAQAVLGSAKMVLESGEHPWELTDRVCSPGGTTIEGVAALQKDGFEAAVCDAVDAAVNKDRNM